MGTGVRVFIASSVDGFIAGPDDDLSWLPQDPVADFGYDAFMAGTGALLMGRGTYDVAAGFDPWPYGSTPVLVATSRPLEPAAPTVRAVCGSPRELLAQVREVTDRGVYLDGGRLIRAFLAEGLVEEMTVTVIPVILGAGSPLFAGLDVRVELELVRERTFDGGILQLTYRPAAGSPGRV